jgi:hypothetical protein
VSRVAPSSVPALVPRFASEQRSVFNHIHHSTSSSAWVFPYQLTPVVNPPEESSHSSVSLPVFISTIANFLLRMLTSNRPHIYGTPMDTYMYWFDILIPPFRYAPPWFFGL